MIAELGNYALALALALSVFLAVLPLIGAEKANVKLMALARPLTWSMFLALSLSFGALFYLFAVNDFSVQYGYGCFHSGQLVWQRLPVRCQKKRWLAY